MARPVKTSIVNVFAWFSNVIDTEELTLTDTAIMTHIIKNLNRNFWKPTKMSLYKLFKTTKSDIRTIRGSLKRLAEKHIIFKRDGDIFAKIEDPAKFFSSKVKDTDPDNLKSGIYFSIILRKDGEFHIGIETENHYLNRIETENISDNKPRPNTAPNVTERTDDGRPTPKVKSLADYMPNAN